MNGYLYFNDAADEQMSDALRAAAGLLTPTEIRQNREKLGYTQRQLADYLRISMFTVSRWETGGQIQQRAMDGHLRVFFQSREARRILGVPDDTASDQSDGARVGGNVAVQDATHHDAPDAGPAVVAVPSEQGM